MSDVDPRIQRALENLPEADPEARARARQAALGALPLPRQTRRPRWRFAIATSVGAVLLAGTALAATDRLDLRLGKPTPAKPAVVEEQPFGDVTVPNGAKGLAVVADGRLWLKTASGLGVQGLAVTTAELSPNALYVAVGIDQALVAMTPGGRRAWAHQTGGRVISISWAPNPIVVAYTVRTAARLELHVIEGNGDNDRLVDADVGDARPSWRADTLALAYVGRDGRPRVADYPSLVTRAASGGQVSAVSFAPQGFTLIREDTGPALALTDGTTGSSFQELSRTARLVGLAWSTAAILAIAGDEGSRARLWTLGARPQLNLKASGSAYAPRIDAISAIPDRGGLAVALPVAAERQVWEVTPPDAGTDQPLKPRRVLLRLPRSAGPIEMLSIR